MMRGEQGGPGNPGKRIIQTVHANLTAGKSNSAGTPPLNYLMTNLERNAAFYSLFLLTLFTHPFSLFLLVLILIYKHNK